MDGGLVVGFLYGFAVAVCVGLVHVFWVVSTVGECVGNRWVFGVVDGHGIWVDGFAIGLSRVDCDYSVSNAWDVGACVVDEYFWCEFCLDDL